MLEDPWVAPPEDAFALTSSPADAPPPVEVVIGFEAGVPVSLDDEELSLAELIAALNAQAGPYGIGRIDMVENRAVGIKSRELYEAPAAMTLIHAHQALEDLVLTKAEAIAKREIEAIWARTVYDGLWFSPVREALDAFVAKTQELVSGEVRVRLQAGAPATGRTALRARALRARARVVRRRGRLSARRVGGVHPARRDGGRARGGPGTEGRARVTLWAGRVGGELAPTSGSSCAPTTPSSCRTTGRQPSSMRNGCTPRASSTTTSSPRCPRSWRRGRGRRPARTRTCTRRSSGSSAPSGGRSTPAGRATTRSQPRCGSTSQSAAREADAAIRSSAPSCSIGPKPTPTRRCPATRTCSAHPGERRPPPARLGRDARARPRALRRRRRWRDAVPARSRRARRLDARAAAAGRRADAQLARRRRGPRLRARLPLRVHGARSRTCRASARSSSSGRRPSSGS